MSESLIVLKGVSKKFILNDQTEENCFKMVVSLFKEKKQALNNINLTIDNGEIVGVVGKKSSGKTILLKIISGIIQPTSGFVKVNKTIFPVIDNSKTCFHPEFTVKESIFLFSSLLGVEKKKMKDKFLEIVGFVDLDSIIDKKIKHYPPNMINKIALTAAMFLDPEILLIDSMIPQDKLFLEKIQKKVKELKQAGVTVLIAAESLGMIKGFCDRYIVLSKGSLVYDSCFHGLESDRKIEDVLVTAS